MNKTKILSFVAMLPLLTAVAALGSLTEANAVNSSTQSEVDRLSPNSFGSDTNVCGDKLCDELDMQKSGIDNVEVIDAYPLSGDHFKILIKIDSSSESVTNEKIYVKSDITKRIIAAPFIKANSHDYVVTTIKSTSADAIKVSFEPTKIAQVNFGEPQVKITDISNISTQDNTYRVIFDITTEEFSAKNIKIQISSDSDTIQSTTGGLFENNVHTNQVILKAINPKSVNVQVVDFEINR